MFDKIGRCAEKVATSAGESRRGFLGLMGKGALSLAGLVGALLLLPRQAQASTGCLYCCPDGTVVGKNCPCGNSINHKGMTCGLCEKNCNY